MFLRQRTFKLPLFWKFAIISSLLVTVFGIVNIFFLWSSVYTSFEKEIDKRCKVLAKIVSDKALNPMVYDDMLTIYNILDEIKQSDPSISYIFILSNTNILVANTYGVNINPSLLKANGLNGTEFNIEVIKTSNYKYPTIRDIAYPIMGGTIGTVRLGIVEEHIQQEIEAATRNLLFTMMFFFVFGLIGAFIFSYLITNPIKIISKRAEVLDFNSIDSNTHIITKRKRFRIFNVQMNDELDFLVTKFSEMISRLRISYTELKETQRALVQAEKLASLGTLSAGVAHEINNPISGIKNCIKRIIKDPDNTERNLQYILLIQEATDKIENVVHHLLNFSRKQDFLFEKVNLNSIIENSISLTAHKTQSKGVSIKSDFTDEFYIYGSANHLEQVFVNLILNSLDAVVEKKEKIPNFNGLISIDIRRKGTRVFAHFIDNGIGIPEGNKDKIYDPFFTSKEVGKGTGLGLSVSFNIISEHNGNISFRSFLSLGTEFIIELPCYKESFKPN